MLLHSLCYGSKCCWMLAALCWKSSGSCKDCTFLCREEQERPWRTDIKHIFWPNLTEEFNYVAWVLWWMLANSDTKNCVGIKVVFSRLADIWLTWQHVAGMSVIFSAKLFYHLFLSLLLCHQLSWEWFLLLRLLCLFPVHLWCAIVFAFLLQCILGCKYLSHFSCTFELQWWPSRTSFRRHISCTIFLPLLIGTPYLTSQYVISSMSLCGFFLFDSLSFLNVNSSLVSAMELSELKSPWSSIQSFHALPIGKSFSASFCRLILLRRFIVGKVWMNWHIAFLFKSTASVKFFSSSTAKMNSPFSFVGSLVSKLGSKHASSPC